MLDFFYKTYCVLYYMTVGFKAFVQSAVGYKEAQDVSEDAIRINKKVVVAQIRKKLSEGMLLTQLEKEQLQKYEGDISTSKSVIIH